MIVRLLSYRKPEVRWVALFCGSCLLGSLSLVSGQVHDPYEGSLDRGAARGVETVSHPVADGRPQEVAIIPNHLAFAAYRGANGQSDQKTERTLAAYDFYISGNTPENAAVALCPKAKSTSAAVELFEIPAGSSKPAQETAAYCSGQQKTGKDLAKFKQTDNHFTTTSTAAILGYYHVSRVLGDICLIQPAVLRTMDVEQHRKIVDLASAMGIRGLVGKSWALFKGYYQNPSRSSVASVLFTNDFKQIYGALLVNTRGEEHYDEWLRAGPNLTSTRAFRDMADPRSVQAILGSTTFSQVNVQRMVAMRDMSEMILLDFLMSQSDRLSGGNISDFNYLYKMEAGHVTAQRQSKKADNAEGAVLVKRLTLVDTDAGLLNQNVFEQKGYLNQIGHLHPEVYHRLVSFAQKWKEDSSVPDFFHRECTLSQSQVARFGRNLANASALLQQRFSAGKLRLDLDLDEYFASNPSAGDTAAASVLVRN
jgi:hypothetical protein